MGKCTDIAKTLLKQYHEKYYSGEMAKVKEIRITIELIKSVGDEEETQHTKCFSVPGDTPYDRHIGKIFAELYTSVRIESIMGENYGN